MLVVEMENFFNCNDLKKNIIAIEIKKKKNAPNTFWLNFVISARKTSWKTTGYSCGCIR